MNFGHEKCWYIFVRLWRLDGWTAEVAFRFLAKGAPYLARMIAHFRLMP